jgi:hypothetical protein
MTFTDLFSDPFILIPHIVVVPRRSTSTLAVQKSSARQAGAAPVESAGGEGSRRGAAAADKSLAA